MRTISRRQKREALALIQSRRLSVAMYAKLQGWIEAVAKREIEGTAKETTAKTLADFVRSNNAEIRNCPLL